jgi:acetylornithine/succinyldiaminopimelate/putrescine aminotransferase
MFFSNQNASGEKRLIINEFASHVSSGKAAFFNKYGMNFVMGEREGPWLKDIDGQKSLYNLHCNGGVFNLGHRQTELINLLREQLVHYDIGNHHLMSKPRAELATLLARLMPGTLNYSVFGASGGESIDLAIKIARGYTQRRRIVSVLGGYHGHTGLSVQAGDAAYREKFLFTSNEFVQVPFNDLKAMDKAVNKETAAVLLEPIPATLGMPIPGPGYLKNVESLCRDRGALLILDEVQTGLGRTGKLWAFEHFDLQPDIVVLGKGLSGGLYPITATVFAEKLESIFQQDPFIHISTFGGAELGSILAKRVLEISSDAHFLAHVNRLSDLLSEELATLQQKHSRLFKRVHRLGLMMALELNGKLAGPVFTKTAYDNDLLMIYANNDTSRVQFLPPLVMEEKDIPLVMEKLDKAFTDLKKLLPLVKAKATVSSLFKA